MTSRAVSTIYIVVVFTAVHISEHRWGKPNIVEGSSLHRARALGRFNETIQQSTRKKQFLSQMLRSINRSHNNSNGAFRLPFKHTDVAGKPPLPPPDLLSRSEKTARVERTPFERQSRGWSTLQGQANPVKIRGDTATFNIKTLYRPGERLKTIKLVVFVYRKKPKKKTKKRARSFRELQSGSCKDGQRSRNIHLIVRLIDLKNSNDPNNILYEEKTKICKSDWYIMQLPITKFQSLANKESLRIKIECSKCNKRTSLILPHSKEDCMKMRRLRRKRRRRGKAKRRTGRSGRSGRQRPHVRNCVPRSLLKEKTHYEKYMPRLIFEQFGSSFPRPKRSPDQSSLHCKIPFSSSHKSNPTSRSQGQGYDRSSGNSTSCCQMVKTYIDFSDLNLEKEIISPSGFNFATCTTICPEDFESRHRLQDAMSEIIKKQLRKTRPLSRWNHNPLNLSSVLTKISRIPNRSRLKGRRLSFKACIPAKRENLHVLHLTKDSVLKETVVPDFFVSDCKCNSS